MNQYKLLTKDTLLSNQEGDELELYIGAKVKVSIDNHFSEKF